MKTVDAETVAEELVKIFLRVGLPREMLMDQGSTSQLLAEIYRLLHVKALQNKPLPSTDQWFGRTVQCHTEEDAVHICN